MTRILQVVGHAAGGIGVHVADLSAGLRAAGDAVRVVVPAATAGRFDLGDAGSGGVDTRAWPVRSSPQAYARGLARLRRVVRASDVVHAHGHQAGLTALLAAAGTGVPVVVSWHNAILARRGPGALAERWQARRAALVTGASQDLVDRAAALGARRSELAPVAAPAAGRFDGDRAAARAVVRRALRERGESGADPATDPATEPASDDGEVWILTVSRIAPQKDLGVLVEAARLVQREGAATAVRWFVVGDGDAPLRAELERAAEGLPFHLVGAREDVPAWMAAADVLVVPSRWEARALVVQEALAAGLPVVATDVGGLPELVTGCGSLVPVGHAPAIAAAVTHLVTHPERRADLAARARERFAQLPTSADVVSAWRERYASLAPAKR
ncbi:glycosyltransferase family 4 protein [Litorihabitans aurantiacus]|uniref:D-inositol 3-phosphate glycosyltransferase n=1 Tax=Litorihabitans aurantiacus TaxID=1930061 RepID=A0AA37XEB4_9MICO|nr:glycosyltransferase family 4 protein [Litorihabitans aurantiacus]GMA31642.1 glycosyl transferase [Litorihabitans aurantiacus]